ncbi:MAG TPA: diacylglycerol kinase family protein [Motilibacteraceae bacterium]|nr:diacylglycerol kinase family protein [Motilibacteraceae bacterium]
MRAALVVNPTKVDDVDALAEKVAKAGADRGWEAPLVLLTTEEDPGQGMAREALAAGVDVVMACGGDGTVRCVATALAGSGVPLAVLPAGTGNLLVRNLELATDLDEALAVALDGAVRTLDLGRAGDERFAVMAGLGLDASLTTDVPERLKARVGWLAYVVSAARHLRDPRFTVRMRLDDGPTRRVRARTVVVGNVGRLQGGLVLLPDAVPDDGLLDVVVVAPSGPVDWLRVAGRVLARRPYEDPRLHRARARRVELEATPAQPSELDGDDAGERSRLLLEVEPDALLLKVGVSS